MFVSFFIFKTRLVYPRVNFMEELYVFPVIGYVENAVKIYRNQEKFMHIVKIFL